MVMALLLCAFPYKFPANIINVITGTCHEIEGIVIIKRV